MVLRGTAEYAVFKSTWGERFQSVAIHTDKDIRFERMMARGRSEDGGIATFEARDEREKGWGLEELDRCRCPCRKQRRFGSISEPNSNMVGHAHLSLSTSFGNQRL